MSCEREKVVADVEYSGVTKFASKFVYNTSTSPACALIPGECSIGTELHKGRDESFGLGLARICQLRREVSEDLWFGFGWRGGLSSGSHGGLPF